MAGAERISRGHMSRMQKRPAAAGDDLLLAVGALVALVVVQVAGEEYGDLAAKDTLLEVAQGIVGVAGERRIALGIDPLRARHAEDDVGFRGHARRDITEIALLRLVHLGTELKVDGAKPPVPGQLQREVAAGLAGGATCEAALGTAEEPRERDQTVEPVMVAGHCEYFGRATGGREGCGVWGFGALFVGAARGIRIDLITTEHEHAARAGVHNGAVRALDIELRGGDAARDGVGGVEAITDIAHEVEPEFALRCVGLEAEHALRLVGERFDETRVRVPAEEIGDGHHPRRLREHIGVVPADHLGLLGGNGWFAHRLIRLSRRAACWPAVVSAPSAWRANRWRPPTRRRPRVRPPTASHRSCTAPRGTHAR